ncbi:MAG: glutamine-hydrolyzing GMP synthase [Xanthomonadales bacterium]|nr:glutamine-hydrolyzing GMP synthase [Xanthomonadales bacterium]
MSDIHAHRLLILDFGSQYTQLIARRVREIGVYSEIMAWDVDEQAIRDFAPVGIILSGSPESTTEGDLSPRVPQLVFELGIPVLGICYGMQTMAAQLGGAVEACDHKEFGYAKVAVDQAGALLQGIEDEVDDNGTAHLDVWMSHGDRVASLPEGFKRLCGTESAPLAGMADEERRFYGVQFHPEVTHTAQGKRILERFVRDICQAEANWSIDAIIDDQIERVRAQVGNEQVLLGLSGGVDSAVVAALLHKAIGDQLVCIFVDTGLLRYGEADQVMATFGQHMGINLIKVDAGERFLKALEGESDPEAKRKIIGRVFIEVFEEESNRLEGVKWLAQGTIYPDVIESAGSKTGKAHVIKSHHNVGGLPDYMKLKLLEPLRELFKDEVRRMGAELGLAREMIQRHPFPGPGLGVRILGEIKPEYTEILAKADHIFIEELTKAGFYHDVAQAFAVFLPVKSVGVVGDARRYAYVISLRAVETVDFVTARAARLPWDLLDLVSRRIINDISGVSRVVYDISSKPPATIEWE